MSVHLTKHKTSMTIEYFVLSRYSFIYIVTKYSNITDFINLWWKPQLHIIFGLWSQSDLHVYYWLGGIVQLHQKARKIIISYNLHLFNLNCPCYSTVSIITYTRTCVCLCTYTMKGHGCYNNMNTSSVVFVLPFLLGLF